LRDGEEESRDQSCGPDFDHSVESGERQNQPKRHQKREKGKNSTGHGTELEQVEAADSGERDQRSAQRAEGYRRRVGDERESGSLQRLETDADQEGGRDGNGSAEAAGALEECAEGEGDEDKLKTAILRDAHEALLEDFEVAGFAGEVVHEDDVEDDPADGEEAVEDAVDGGHRAHFQGHAEDGAGDCERGGEAEEGGEVSFDPEDGKCAQKYQNGNGCKERGEQPVACGVVVLGPGHAAMPPSVLAEAWWIYANEWDVKFVMGVGDPLPCFCVRI